MVLHCTLSLSATIMVLHYVLSDILRHYQDVALYTTVTWDHFMISTVHYVHTFHDIDNEQPDKLAEQNYLHA